MHTFLDSCQHFMKMLAYRSYRHIQLDRLRAVSVHTQSDCPQLQEERYKVEAGIDPECATLFSTIFKAWVSLTPGT